MIEKWAFDKTWGFTLTSSVLEWIMMAGANSSGL